MRPPLPLLLLCAGLAPLFGMRPGIPRVTWTTDHFALTIDEKKQDQLPYLAALAEECYAKQAAFFGYRPPGRIQVAFLDERDQANGFAYAPEEWVVIHMHSGDIRLRGKTRWLPGVLSHELGHIFTLRKMGKVSRFLGADLFHHWRGKGSSTFGESFVWSHGLVPPWLAEGLAQYAAGVCGYDTLDTHRQMVLRVAAASGALLSLAELKTFAWDGRRNEMIYAQGYGLVSYLYRTFGSKAANRYLDLAASKGWRRAFRSAFGKSLESVYADWRRDLEARSRGLEGAGDGDHPLPEPVGPYTIEADPAPLADGRILYLSSLDNDFGRTDLFLGDGKGGMRRLSENATSLDLSADGGSALFTAIRHSPAQGEAISDAYEFDAGDGRISRLTHGARILRACRSGNAVYGVRDNEGHASVVRIAGGEWTTVFVPPDSMEIDDVAPGRTAGSLTLVTVSGFGGDIRELDLASGELSPLAASPQDERDPHWRGDTLWFSADYAGAFDIYAWADEQVLRRTHVAGGAFEPFPSDQGIWYSAYGPKGFRLARARPLEGTAPPFVVELPVPAWKPPAPVEYEADPFDRSPLGFAGYAFSAGVERSPGYRGPATPDSAGAPTEPFSYAAGSKLSAGIGLYWQNPTGLATAEVVLGLSRPLDYQGSMHLDATHAGIAVNAFLPTLLAGADWSTFDFPEARAEGREFIYYQAALTGYAGLAMDLSDHWSAMLLGLVENDFVFAGASGEKQGESDPRPGASLGLSYADLQPGKDGIIEGLSAFLNGESPPAVRSAVPDFTVDAGATAYASLGRFLFLDASLFHSQDWGGAVSKLWFYGGASAYCAIPLGMQLGTRGGAGLYLDQAYPGIEFLEMSRAPLHERDAGAGNRSSARRPFGAPEAGSREARYSPRIRVFRGMLDREMSHALGFTFSLKTLALFPRPETWTAGIRFDAADFGREPVWTLRLSL